jgi:cytochrome c oxidase subunit 3
MSSIPVNHPARTVEWHLPSKRRVGMTALIVGESAIFTIFVVAYVFYMGKSLSGPTPAQVLEIPILATICLLSSSLTIWRAEKAIEDDRMGSFTVWLGATIALAAVFLANTALEWKKLIYQDGLTVSTNLFGTTFYSLVGLHATHVVVGCFSSLRSSSFLCSVGLTRDRVSVSASSLSIGTSWMRCGSWCLQSFT